MSAILANLEDLPRQNASQVKNKWADVVRLVRQEGSVAVTNHSTVEMVLIEASTYRQLTQDLLALRQRQGNVLAELAQRFDVQLDSLKHEDVVSRVDAVFKARGQQKQRPKAGASF